MECGEAYLKQSYHIILIPIPLFLRFVDLTKGILEKKQSKHMIPKALMEPDIYNKHARIPYLSMDLIRTYKGSSHTGITFHSEGMLP